VISGCSGGGKSTLLEELRRRGHAVVEEPGRRIVREELTRGGTALPSVDSEAFPRCAVDMALADLESVSTEAGWVLFDRVPIGAERRHVIVEAVADYKLSRLAYPALGYQAIILLGIGVAARADLVLETLAR